MKKTKITREPFPDNIFEVRAFLTQSLQSANIFRYIYKTFINKNVKKDLFELRWAFSGKKALEMFNRR